MTGVMAPMTTFVVADVVMAVTGWMVTTVTPHCETMASSMTASFIVDPVVCSVATPMIKFVCLIVMTVVAPVSAEMMPIAVAAVATVSMGFSL